MKPYCACPELLDLYYQSEYFFLLIIKTPPLTKDKHSCFINFPRSDRFIMEFMTADHECIAKIFQHSRWTVHSFCYNYHLHVYIPDLSIKAAHSGKEKGFNLILKFSLTGKLILRGVEKKKLNWFNSITDRWGS